MNKDRDFLSKMKLENKNSGKDIPEELIALIAYKAKRHIKTNQ